MELTIEGRFEAKTPKSSELWRRGCQAMPNGVSAAVKFFPPHPIYLDHGSGSHVWDIDGNEYVDLVLGGSPHIMGHNPHAVSQAVHNQIDRLVQHLSPTALEVEMAELLKAEFPYLEKVRFTPTGSEAVRSCVRIARALTNKDMIAKCEGGYHGSDDFALVSVGGVSGPADHPDRLAESAGVPERAVDEVLVIPFNDIVAAEKLIEEYADRLAAILLEPVGFNALGGMPADREFVAMLRRVSTRHNILLVFDEVATGLRLRGGAAEYLGVTPDLSCVGKTISSGYPLAAFGGRSNLMESALGSTARASGSVVFQSGTFSANPVSLAAGIATLKAFGPEVRDRANQVAALIRSGLNDEFFRHGVEAHAIGVESFMQVHFTGTPPRNRREVIAGNMELLRRFYLGLLVEGVFWTPIHPGVTSSVHSDEDVETVLAAAGRVLSNFN